MIAMADPSAAAALLLEFANTLDVEEGTDELSTPAALKHWLAGHGLVAASVTVTERHRFQACALRAGLRERLLVTNGGRADEAVLAAGEVVLAGLPVAVTLAGAPEAVLAPVGADEATRGLARIAAAWALVAACGEWLRLKRCPDPACGWVFWDATRSRSRHWCSMQVCGNRAKARSYAARQRGTGQRRAGLSGTG